MDGKKYLIIWQNSGTDEISAQMCTGTEEYLNKLIGRLVKREAENVINTEDFWTCPYAEAREYNCCVGVVQYPDSHTNYWAMPLNEIPNSSLIKLWRSDEC